MPDNLPPGYYPSWKDLQLEVVNLCATINLSADLIPDPVEPTALGTILQNNGANVPLALDGVDCVVGMRVVVANQVNAAQNGVYVVRDVGSLSTPWQLVRSTDFFLPEMLVAGMYCIINNGLTKNGHFVIVANPLPNVINVDPIVFIQY